MNDVSPPNATGYGKINNEKQQVTSKSTREEKPKSNKSTLPIPQGPAPLPPPLQEQQAPDPPIFNKKPTNPEQLLQQEPSSQTAKLSWQSPDNLSHLIPPQHQSILGINPVKKHQKQEPEQIIHATVTSEKILAEVKPHKKKLELPIPTTDVSKRKVHKEGYLLKLGQNIKFYRKRYFILDSNHLSYYTKQHGNLLNTFEITKECIVTISLDKEHSIELRTPNRVWHFIGQNDEEINEWQGAFQEVIWNDC